MDSGCSKTRGLLTKRTNANRLGHGKPMGVMAFSQARAAWC